MLSISQRVITIISQEIPTIHSLFSNNNIITHHFRSTQQSHIHTKPTVQLVLFGSSSCKETKKKSFKLLKRIAFKCESFKSSLQCIPSPWWSCPFRSHCFIERVNVHRNSACAIFEKKVCQIEVHWRQSVDFDRVHFIHSCFVGMSMINSCRLHRRWELF